MAAVEDVQSLPLVITTSDALADYRAPSGDTYTRLEQDDPAHLEYRITLGSRLALALGLPDTRKLIMISPSKETGFWEKGDNADSFILTRYLPSGVPTSRLRGIPISLEAGQHRHQATGRPLRLRSPVPKADPQPRADRPTLPVAGNRRHPEPQELCLYGLRKSAQRERKRPEPECGAQQQWGGTIELR